MLTMLIFQFIHFLPNLILEQIWMTNTIWNTIGEQESDCKKAGCSGELCVDKDSDIGASACVMKCHYKCLQYQTCGKNQDGECGWEIKVGKEHDYKQCMEECGIKNEL